MTDLKHKKHDYKKANKIRKGFLFLLEMTESAFFTCNVKEGLFTA